MAGGFDRRKIHHFSWSFEKVLLRNWHLLDHLPYGVGIAQTATGRILYANPVLQKWSGFTLAELRRKHIFDLNPQEILTPGFHYNTINFWRSGPALIDLFVQQTGEFTVGIIRKRRDGMNSSWEIYRRQWNNELIGSMTMDMSGCIREASNAWLRFYQLHRDDLGKIYVHDFYPTKEAREACQQRLDDFQQGKARRIAMVRKNLTGIGKEVTFAIAGEVLETDGDPVCVIGSYLRINEKHLEKYA